MKFTKQTDNKLDDAIGQAREQVEMSGSLIAVVTDALRDGLIVCGQDGMIIWINASARKCCRVEWTSCYGRSISTLVNESIFPMDGIAEAFANKVSMMYVEEDHFGSDYIVDIQRVIVPENSEHFFVISLKNVNAFLKTIRGERFGENFASFQIPNFKNQQGFRQTILDDDLERLIGLGIRAWTYGSRILITGESGVGKSQYARILDKRLNRTGKSFVHVNCASMPESLFESEFFGYEAGSFTGAHAKGKKGLVEIAEKGTLFLDEVGEIPLTCQSKILRFLDDGSYMKVGGTKARRANVRIIGATNQNLRKMVGEDKFRIDLYFRLKTVEIRVPPLRERRSLVRDLICRYLDYIEQEDGRSVTMTQRCGHFLDLYEYPGNIRELENALQHMAIMCDETMDLEHLPEHLREAAAQCGYNLQPAVDDSTGASGGATSSVAMSDTELARATLKTMVGKYERELISRMIDVHGSKRKAAKVLGVDIATVVRKSR